MYTFFFLKKQDIYTMMGVNSTPYLSISLTFSTKYKKVIKNTTYKLINKIFILKNIYI
jgi:hypothetical protein